MSHVTAHPLPTVQCHPQGLKGLEELQKIPAEGNATEREL